MKKTKEGFNCIAFKRKAQERIYREVKNCKPGEEREYFRREAVSGPLGKWWGGTNTRETGKRVFSIAEESSPFSEDGCSEHGKD